MENSKLMTPLFYDGFFNREGRRMRAILDREIINGSTTYRIWRSAGKPDMEYPRAENDKYILHLWTVILAQYGKSAYILNYTSRRITLC